MTSLIRRYSASIVLRCMAHKAIKPVLVFGDHDKHQAMFPAWISLFSITSHPLSLKVNTKHLSDTGGEKVQPSAILRTVPVVDILRFILMNSTVASGLRTNQLTERGFQTSGGDGSRRDVQ